MSKETEVVGKALKLNINYALNAESEVSVLKIFGIHENSQRISLYTT